MSRTHLSLALAFALVVAAPTAAPAGSLSDFAEDLADWVEDGLGRLRDEADRLARKRVVALEKIERLIGREHAGLARELRTANRVATVVDRAYTKDDEDSERAKALIVELLDELDVRYESTEVDARRGADALESLLPGVSRRADRFLAIAAELSARASTANLQTVRARLLDRAARRVRRARKEIRRSGGVVGPYVCHESETGTAAGVVHLDGSSLGEAFSATAVGGLLSTTSRGVVSTLHVEAKTPDGRVVRLAFPPISFDGVGSYDVGPAISQARAELQNGEDLHVGTAGTLSVDAFDLAHKTLAGRFSIEVQTPAGIETVSGQFTLCDILRVD